MHPFYVISIGDVMGDYKCVDIIKKRHTGKYPYISKYYVMECQKCGRRKEMLGATIYRSAGIFHKSCGKGLKTLDPVFYDRWQAMRTRTTNPNYEHADRYVNRGINSEAFKNFIDFYDAMYDSYLELANKIGSHNVSLERKDVNSSYDPDNCIWIPKQDQPKNTSRTVKFKAIYPDGHTEIHKNATDFAISHGIHPAAVSNCLNGKSKSAKGYKFERIE